MPDAHGLKLEILREAIEIVEERGASYGPPADHFARTIGAINAIYADRLVRPFTPADWAVFIMLDKIARHQHVPKHDNLVDVIGYAACAHACGEC